MENGKRSNYTHQKKIGQRDYTDEALVLLNHFRPLMNLWRALMSDSKVQRSPCQGSLTLTY